MLLMPHLKVVYERPDYAPHIFIILSTSVTKDEWSFCYALDIFKEAKSWLVSTRMDGTRYKDIMSS